MADETIEIFTDGACLGNPGAGGWAALLRYKGHQKRLSGGEADTTNNRMELTAAIKALETLRDEQREIDLYCDSKYLLDGLGKYLARWRRNNWRTKARTDVKNRDLWERLDELSRRHRIRLRWVKGHANHPENEEMDELARRAAKKVRG